MKRQWYYRGSLKSCNYSCSYCPFSKKKGSVREKQEDKKALFRFVEEFNQRGKLGGAVQIVPYGEALVLPYYWEALAKLSKNPNLDAVGAQSNFSFPVEQMLALYREQGGDTRKLRLWGTFHPEMTSVEQFVKQCMLLLQAGILFCVGVVGVPENLELIRRLRKALPESVYLWINKMDGLGRNYTSKEIEDFLKIDEYFEMELFHHKADVSLCRDNRFVEADGTMHRCNICRQTVGNFYDDSNGEICYMDSAEHDREWQQACTRKECSCFLAYCNRQEKELLFFQPYPAFRIPNYTKAVFLDVDGTLIPKGHTKIPEEYVTLLQRSARHSRIYLATSLPYEIARKKVKEVWNIIDGGVFANGARCMVKKGDKREIDCDEIEPMDITWLEQAKEKSRELGYTLHTYKKGNAVYKVTMAFRGRRIQDLGKLKIPDTCQLLLEENCVQVTKKGTGKLEGILKICERMGYAVEDVAVAGNAENDIPMLKYFPFSVMAYESGENVIVHR